MKQKDLVIIIVVAFFSAILAFIISGKVIVTPAHRQQEVEVVQAINTQFNQPDTTYFNANAIDPTQLIRIGNNSNKSPFNSTNTQ